jgi:hypothetical protein
LATHRPGQQRGLPSLAAARAERSRALIGGKVRLRAMSPSFWLWSAVVIGAILVVYWRYEEGQLQSQISKVMARQRATAQALGPIMPFRDHVESWALDLAKTPEPKLVVPGTSLEHIAESPGVYLRLRIESAKDSASIRKAAVASLHDGFTSCFFVRTTAGDPTSGPACKAPKDCQPGLLCNEYDVCAPPPEPFNMRLLYRALRVLSDEWSAELREASSELGVTAYSRDLDSVARNDVPIARRVVERAKYFTLVLDEAPPGGVPNDAPDAGETNEERLQRAPHRAKVGIWDLATNQPVVMWHAQAAAQLVQMGRAVTRRESLAAEQRQANSCQLALDVKAAITAREHPAAAP